MNAIARRSSSILVLGCSILSGFSSILASRHPDVVFDPSLVYSTFLGGTAVGVGGAEGSNTDFSQGITASFVDASGNIYVAGATSAADFPVTAGVVQSTNAQNSQVGFLSKLDPAGKILLFSTYLNGMGSVGAITLDSAGNIYVAGIAPRANPTALPIPSTSTPFQSAPRPISIVKLNSTATSVLAATYFGGSGSDYVNGLAIDSSHNVYISGTTTSNDFPTHNPIQSSLQSAKNFFATELNPTLSSLVYSTYLGQTSTALDTPFSSFTRSHGLAMDSSGDAYLVGTASSGFATTSGACATGANCALLAKLNPAGSAILFSTYLGAGSANAVAVDASQNVYVGGLADSGFPEVNSLQSCGASGSSIASGFVSEISAAGSLTFSTCLGQTTDADFSTIGVADLVLDSSANVYVVGAIGIIGAPTLPLMDPIQSNPGGANEFVAAIKPSTASLLFSSYIGGGSLTSVDTPTSVGIDSAGNIYASGFSGTLAQSIPTMPIYNALQAAPGLANPNFPCIRCQMADGFIAKIAPVDAPAAAVLPGALDFATVPVGTSSPQTLTVLDLGSTALTVSNASATGDFAIQDGCTTSVTPAGGTCAIQVTFTPTAAGARAGVLTITDNSAGSPRTVALSGVGGASAATLAPASLTFPTTAANTTSAVQTVTLTNPGAVDLQVSQVQVTGPFAETNTCGTSVFANAGTCKITVTFTPTANGPASGTVTISDSAANSPQIVTLAGTGGTPGIGLGVASGGSASASVSAGSSATYSLSIGGQGTSGTASLTCTGAPTGASCSIPATVQINASTASAFQITVNTTARSHVWFLTGGPTSWIWTLAILAGLLLWKAAPGRPVARLRWRVVPLLAVALCACGGGSSGGEGTQAGTYTLVVTAKVGSTTQTQNLSLAVK